MDVNSRIFRKVALDRLSSPEQLDQVLRVTSPKGWAALIALFALLAVFVAWGFAGSIPTKVSGQAVIVRTGNVSSVVSIGSGLVVSVNVGVGDKVQPQQVVAKVAQPAMLEKIKVASEALEAARQERGRAMKVATDSSHLQVEALKRKRANTDREITELEDQARLAGEQIPVQDQLLAKGLVTKAQTIAARQKLILIQDQIATQHAQLKEFEAQQYALEAQPQQTYAQSNATVRDQERDLAALNQELELMENVVSPYGGEVIEMKANPGTLVEAGASILSIQPDVKDLEALVYLPSRMAKDVSAQMKVEISPSTVKRGEYGFLKGAVEYVADYPATTAALMRNFQNEALVQALTSEGPVTELRVQLQRDNRTVSGFAWSSRKGPPLKLSSGTICTTEIVTREQRPISLMFPHGAK
jgi:HlyD family secretion protein